jgi:hypothetical protein
MNEGLGGAHIGIYYGSLTRHACSKVAYVIFCKKPCMGFLHMLDVMATWIPWENVDEYINKIKNNNDAPYQWVRLKVPIFILGN